MEFVGNINELNNEPLAKLVFHGGTMSEIYPILGLNSFCL